MHIRSRALTLVLAVSVLAGAAGDALAKKPRSHVTAIANGKRLKASKRGIQAPYSHASFSLAGATKLRRGVTRTVTATCLGDVRAVTPPATLTCFGTYTEARKRTSGFRQWTGDLTVVVETVDGNRIGGTFSGLLTDPSSANPTDAASNIESGSFTVELFDLGV